MEEVQGAVPAHKGHQLGEGGGGMRREEDLQDEVRFGELGHERRLAGRERPGAELEPFPRRGHPGQIIQYLSLGVSFVLRIK